MPRNTKAIDNKTTPICSPHPLESLESPIVIPDSQPALLVTSKSRIASMVLLLLGAMS